MKKRLLSVFSNIPAKFRRILLYCPYSDLLASTSYPKSHIPLLHVRSGYQVVAGTIDYPLMLPKA